ncbi:unnamed protein product [Acanthoscelides obtectus]|uniref:Regulatory protein zeste n=1 Tax=Acanthoscelides obtectus TaxID=200917 RepID=A0A9P0NYC4_ACAOB|nr:unnamed protein product [Acanthoscelides obtectus]CAK1658438.1 hypothetical protein AOBTE_LOCUS20891 [Acanthoscelides obtectus]
MMLISLVSKNKDVIESKTGGTVTWKQKSSVWQSIEQEFRALTGCHREAKTLRDKYFNSKKKTKSKFATNKSNNIMPIASIRFERYTITRNNDTTIRRFDNQL